MNTNSLFIALPHRHAGSLLTSPGMMLILRQHYEESAFYRPIVEQKNHSIEANEV